MNNQEEKNMKTKKFEREERYIVVKLKRINKFEQDTLREFLGSWQIPTEEGVVVEYDWANYDHVWETVEQVATGEWSNGAWVWLPKGQSIASIKASAIDDAISATRCALTDTGDRWLCRVDDLQEYAEKLRQADND